MLSSANIPRWTDSFSPSSQTEDTKEDGEPPSSSKEVSDGYVGGLLGWKSVKERFVGRGNRTADGIPAEQLSLIHI